MAIYLLDNSLKVEIFFEENDSEFEDDICISIVEECVEEEKIFKADETNIYLTPQQACHLASALERAAIASGKFSDERCQDAPPD